MEYISIRSLSRGFFSSGGVGAVPTGEGHEDFSGSPESYLPAG